MLLLLIEGTVIFSNENKCAKKASTKLLQRCIILKSNFSTSCNNIHCRNVFFMFNIFLRVFASEDTQFQNAKRYAMEIFMFDNVSPELF
jgi:hypothetical protein